MTNPICKICGRPEANYSKFLEKHGVVDAPPFPPEGECGRAHQAQDYYDNGQCEDCATYPLKKRIAELEKKVESLTDELDAANVASMGEYA